MFRIIIILLCLTALGASGWAYFVREWLKGHVLDQNGNHTTSDTINHLGNDTIFSLQSDAAVTLPDASMALAVVFNYPVEFVSQGCYTPSFQGHPALLYNQIQLSRANTTVKSCTEACANKLHPYAGLEYTGDCWCGDRLENGSSLSQDPEKCKRDCGSDESSKPCGEAKYLSLWFAKDFVPPSTCPPGAGSLREFHAISAPKSSLETADFRNGPPYSPALQARHLNRRSFPSPYLPPSASSYPLPPALPSPSSSLFLNRYAWAGGAGLRRQEIVQIPL